MNAPAGVLYYINSYQQELNAKIAGLFRELGTGSVESVVLILGLAFLYGVLHAAGPGHGKSIVASYFLSSKERVGRAVAMGYMIAAVHTVSALGITLVLYYTARRFLHREFLETSGQIMVFSGSLLIFLGFYMLYEAYTHRDKEEAENMEGSAKKRWAVAFAAGAVPCPGVMTVLLFSLMLGHLAVGIGAAVLMSIGMGMTISLAGILGVKTRSASTGLLPRLIPVFQWGSPLLLVTFGTLLVV